MNNADRAAKLILGNRQDDYGNPRHSLDGIAMMWTGLLNEKLKSGETIRASDVALLMTALKLRREMANHKTDNLVDAHGYILLNEWLWSGIPPVPEGQSSGITTPATT